MELTTKYRVCASNYAGYASCLKSYMVNILSIYFELNSDFVEKTWGKHSDSYGKLHSWPELYVGHNNPNHIQLSSLSIDTEMNTSYVYTMNFQLNLHVLTLTMHIL